MDLTTSGWEDNGNLSERFCRLQFVDFKKLQIISVGASEGCEVSPVMSESAPAMKISEANSPRVAIPRRRCGLPCQAAENGRD